MKIILICVGAKELAGDNAFHADRIAGVSVMNNLMITTSGTQ